MKNTIESTRVFWIKNINVIMICEIYFYYLLTLHTTLYGICVLRS